MEVSMDVIVLATFHLLGIGSFLVMSS
jgi:hypothetical protein